MGKKSNKRSIEQVSSKSQTPPVEPLEPTEADIDFKTEENEIEKAQKLLNSRKAALKSNKKQALGGKKLEGMRSYAANCMGWLAKDRKKSKGAAARFVISVYRTNDAIDKLEKYEGKLGIPADKQLSQQLLEGERLGLYTDAAEILLALHGKK